MATHQSWLKAAANADFGLGNTHVQGIHPLGPC